MLLVNQDNPIFGHVSSSNRTNGYTWGVITLVAQLGNEEAFPDIYIPVLLVLVSGFKSVSARIWRIYKSLSVSSDGITLYPGSVVPKILGNLII